MKTFFKSDELATHWVEQVYPVGRCPSNMSFHGPSFYSYGMEIGRVIFRKGKKAYLVTTDGYSVTTSKHKNICRYAIPDGSIVFRVCCLGGMHPTRHRTDAKAVVSYSLSVANRKAAKAARARERKLDRLAEQLEWIEQAELATEFFELPPLDFEAMKLEVRRQMEFEFRLREARAVAIATAEAEEKEDDEAIGAVRAAFATI